MRKFAEVEDLVDLNAVFPGNLSDARWFCQIVGSLASR